MYAMQGLTSLEAIAIWAVFGIAIVGLLYALFLRSQILRYDKGTKEMQEIWNAIKSGADAYLRRQFNSIWPTDPFVGCRFVPFRLYCAAISGGLGTV